VPAVR